MASSVLRAHPIAELTEEEIRAVDGLAQEIAVSTLMVSRRAPGR